ncbi:MAG TPA: hypothetical protein VHQ65_12210 [Thermoanaerobaculia bacterium]|nr:hypothetical protein [Thermoanaerobaculia bacterium]
MLYEKLNPEMRHMVDVYAQRLADVPWRQCSDALAEAARPFNDQFSEEEAHLAARGFVTAVIERIGTQPVAELDQALLYRLSLDPEHRQLAQSWLDDHPELGAAVEQEMGPS